MNYSNLGDLGVRDNALVIFDDVVIEKLSHPDCIEYYIDEYNLYEDYADFDSSDYTQDDRFDNVMCAERYGDIVIIINRCGTDNKESLIALYDFCEDRGYKLYQESVGVEGYFCEEITDICRAEESHKYNSISRLSIF